jgi:hypothetical protein
VSCHGLYVFHFEHARVAGDRNARSGINGLRPAAYKGTEAQYFEKGDVVYLLRERKASVDCEERRMHSERFEKESG